MQFSHIVDLIDAYLERLIEARRLLADFAISDTQKKSTTITSAHIATTNPVVGNRLRAPMRQNAKLKLQTQEAFKGEVKKPKTESTRVSLQQDRGASLAAALELQPIPVKPRELEIQSIEKSAKSEIKTRAISRTRKPSPRKPAPKDPVKSGALALGGNIPTGPIVVQADQIRHEQSLRQRASETKASDPSSIDVPLTAELLAQRWTQRPNEIR